MLTQINCHNSGHYPQSCLLFKIQRLGDWILSSYSGETYSVGLSGLELASLFGPYICVLPCISLTFLRQLTKQPVFIPTYFTEHKQLRFVWTPFSLFTSLLLLTTCL
jgi:hypothetical protein